MGVEACLLFASTFQHYSILDPIIIIIIIIFLFYFFLYVIIRDLKI
jgi:hypothetical protein